MRTQTGRADLIRALKHGPDLLDCVAPLLGFEPTYESPRPAPPPLPPPPTLPRRVQGSKSVPARQVFIPAETQFWQTKEFHERKPTRRRRVLAPQPEILGDPWTGRPTNVIWSEHLASAASVLTRLRQVVNSRKELGEPDVDAAVERISEGRFLEEVPRLARRVWGQDTVLVIDRSLHLAPYWADQDFLKSVLATVLPPDHYSVATMRDGVRLPELADDGPADTLFRPPLGGLVLVLGDLGCLASRSSDVQQFWLELGIEIRCHDSRPLALFPANPGWCSEALGDVWEIIPWEATHGSRPWSSESRDELVEELLILAAPAIRVEPGLLRSLRRLLDETCDDAGLESLVWQHIDVNGSSSVAAVLNLEMRRNLLRKTLELPDDLLRRVLDRIRRMHAGLHAAVWFEEIISTEGEIHEQLVQAKDHADAVQYLKSFAVNLGKTIIEEGRLNDVVMWFCDLAERLPDGAWNHPELADELHHALELIKPRKLPGGVNPDLLTPGANPKQLVIGQRGQFFFASKDIGKEIGSPLGYVDSTNFAIQITSESVFDVDCDFWADGSPPAWASRWGIDEFGPWAEFRVETPKTGDKSVSQRMRWIGPGTFLMGSPEDEPERAGDEGPQHQVTISRGYWMFDTACTQALWEAVTGENPSHFKGPQRPVEQVSWQDCQQFLTRLRELVPELEVTLPTEAQWEYACRAGTTTAFSFGENITPEWVNYHGNYPYAGAAKGLYRQETVEVGSLPANPWGLYEMNGNVWEWCLDGRRHYAAEAMVDPVGPEEASANRVVRGGSWNYYARRVRAAVRLSPPPGPRDYYIGFRGRVQSCEPSRQAAEPRRRTERAVSSRSGKAEPRGDSSPASGVPGGDDMRSATPATPVPQEPARDLDENTVSDPLTGQQFLQALAEIPLVELPRPAWASEFGRDEIGLYADLQVKCKSTATVTQRLRLIPPGTFLMGSPDGEDGRYDDEGPQHAVTITQAFWMFDTPCTQAFWEAVTDEDPSHFKGSDRPVECVSWEDCQKFNERVAKTVSDLQVELPTEAEWEYACRAGTTTATYAGDLNIKDHRATELDAIAWYWDNSQRETKPVRQKQANAWGLFDTLGNVREWCLDGQRAYQVQEEVDPGGPAPSADRVVRGGSWSDDARYVRAAYRVSNHPGARLNGIGFRCRVQDRELQQAVSEGRASARRRSPRSGGDSRATSVARAAWINLIEQESDQTPVPQGPAARIVTDVEELTLRRISKPAWASAIGRDRFGLWAEFEWPLADAENAAIRSVPRAKAGVVTQRLRWIPPGRFMMGSPKGETGRYDENEFEPRLQVVERGFWLFDTPCTQALWKSVMGENPSYFQSSTRPVEQVSWEDCQQFCDRLRADAGIHLGLPTEAEWEYACRAATKDATYGGPIEIFGANNAPVLDKIAWYGGNCGVEFDLADGYKTSWHENQYEFDKGGTRIVATKDPNPWGLYDMLGNVWEWCDDVWRLPGQEDSKGASADRVVRGGSWLNDARNVRAASRRSPHPEFRYYLIGFRCRVQESELQQEAGSVRDGASAERRSPRSGGDSDATSGIPHADEPAEGFVGRVGKMFGRGKKPE